MHAARQFLDISGMSNPIFIVAVAAPTISATIMT